MKQKIILGAALLSAGVLAWAAKDPVVMTVNGVDVPLSEFEYLYNKNAQQQASPQSLEDYVEMFTNYKLKVADAKAAGIDTLTSFRNEMAQYRSDLAAPYLADSVYLNSLVDEAAARALTDVPASHIMIFKNGVVADEAKGRATLDSLRGVIAAGGDFAALASQYSQDRGSSSRGGNLGYISQGRYPYSFETAVYSLKPGQVSDVVESPVGFHLIKVGESRPDAGTVLVGHIMKMVPKGSTPEQQAAAKQAIDSIYNVLQADPSRFNELAQAESDDPGSARKGGMLPWFGTGQMVPEFEAAAFALDKDRISEPVKSEYGWHIIRKFDSRPAPTKAELKPKVLQRIQHPQDERFSMVRKRQMAKLAAKHKAKYADKAVAALHARMAGGLDSLFYEEAASPVMASTVLASVGKNGRVVLADVIPMMRRTMTGNADAAKATFDRALENAYYNALVNAETDWLEANVADYRNLLHEYRDGSLLYEVSVRNVWDKAPKDTEGLENYFRNHRADYKWSAPRVKGLLVQTKNDSVAAALKARYLELGGDTIVTTLRKEFGKNAKIDRILLPQGSNAMVDNLMFNGPEAQPAAGYTAYFLLSPRVLNAPEEMADVRPQVISDYQMLLDEAWIRDLRTRYPVSVNQKVLKKVKPLRK